jgi:hypothetical protein
MTKKISLFVLALFTFAILASGCATAVGGAAGAGAGALTGAAIGAGTGAAKGAEVDYNVIMGVDNWIKKNLW